MANTLFTTKAYSTVRRELFARGSGVIEKADSIWVCCPFHGESTASCKVNTTEGGVPFGWYYCFGCNANGPWNSLAEKMNMQKFSKSDLKSIDGFASDLGKKYARIKRNLTEEVDHTNDISRFDEMIERNHLMPVAVDWREIKKQTLIDLGCQRIIDKRNGDTYLIIPITIEGETRGVVRAKWIASKDKNVRNYINAQYGEESWVKNYGLLGYDMIRKMPAFKKYGIVFIVEGPRDAMRMLELGIPTVSILGAGLWSVAKRDLIINLGPELVCSLMDNDKAGRKAGKRITESFARRMNFHCFVLPKDKKVGYKIDPMSMTAAEHQVIWNQARRMAK